MIRVLRHISLILLLALIIGAGAVGGGTTGPGHDRNLEIRKGKVTGHAMVSILGHNDAQTTTRVTISPSMTTATIDQSSLDATPATVKVASTNANDTSAGTGLRTLTLKGLDTNGAAQSETITLNGQTEVTSSLTYSAVTGWKGLTAGSGGKNDGVVWVGTGTFTSGVPDTKFFSGDIGYNKGFTAYYVVPAGKTLHIFAFAATLASSNKAVEFFIDTSADGVFWLTRCVFAVESGAAIETYIYSMGSVPAGTHVRVEADSSASNTIVSVVLAGELVDN